MNEHLQDLLSKARSSYEDSQIQESCEFIAKAMDLCKARGIPVPNEFRIVAAQILLHDSLEVMKQANDDDVFPERKE